VIVSGISTATGIAAGGDNSCTALLSGGVRCWGDNSAGQLGNGTLAGSNLPVTVSGITTAVGVSTGEAHTCARRSDGRLLCWGANGAGQLGDGNTGNSALPLNVIQTIFATSVVAGGNHTCALRADSAALCWGSNGLSQLGEVIPAPAAVLGWTSSASAVATIDGSGRALALAPGGTSIAVNYGGRSINTVLTIPGPPDADGDGVADSADNCTLQANPSQLDADSDGYGNLCDADLNNSALVTTADFAILRSVLNQSAGSSAIAAAADLNGSGLVTTADFAILRSRLNFPPGPSGLHP
jgi:hypothetical protein